MPPAFFWRSSFDGIRKMRYHAPEATREMVSKGLPFSLTLSTPLGPCKDYSGATGKLLGSGSFGTVREYDMGEGSTAVKTIKVAVKKEVIGKDIPDLYLKHLKAFNPGLEREVLPMEVYVPRELGVCMTSEERKYGAIPGPGKVVVPKGSYLCGQGLFSEFAIASLLGECFEKGECANFFRPLGFFSCLHGEVGGRKLYHLNYVMDRVQGSFRGGAMCTRANSYLEGCRGPFLAEFGLGLFIQTLFAIAFYQKKFKLSHNDLHLDNVFVEYVKEETEFGGQRLIDADWYRYDLGDKEIFLPAIPVISKIGDCGTSVKYAPPLIGNRRVFVDGMSKIGGAWVPNSFFPSYDSVFFAASVGRVFSIRFFADPEDEGTKTALRLVELLVPPGAVRSGNHRPVLENLGEATSSEEALRSEAFQREFGTRPSSGKIVTLGTLESPS